MKSTRDELEYIVMGPMGSPGITIGGVMINVTIERGNRVALWITDKEKEKYVISFPVQDMGRNGNPPLSLDAVMYFVRLALHAMLVMGECIVGEKVKLVGS